MKKTKRNKRLSLALLFLQMFSVLFIPINYSLAVESPVSSGGYKPLSGPPYPYFESSYFTDDYGNILMYVNILGSVGRPGQYIVREDVNFATLFALIGGVRDEANLRKVLVVRHEPDISGKQAYVLDLKSFYKQGDCSNFIALKPNDTIIIPEKNISMTKLAKVMSIAYPMINLYNILND